MYYAKKVASFYSAVTNTTPESFIYLKTHMIKGIYSAFIRQKVIESIPNSFEALRTSMLQSVAIALECYWMDTGNVGSLDGLAATTIFAPAAGDEPMDISKIDCYTCGREGHIAAKCPRRASSTRQGASTFINFKCFQVECRSLHLQVRDPVILCCQNL